MGKEGGRGEGVESVVEVSVGEWLARIVVESETMAYEESRGVAVELVAGLGKCRGQRSRGRLEGLLQRRWVWTGGEMQGTRTGEGVEMKGVGV